LLVLTIVEHRKVLLGVSQLCFRIVCDQFTLQIYIRFNQEVNYSLGYLRLYPLFVSFSQRILISIFETHIKSCKFTSHGTGLSLLNSFTNLCLGAQESLFFHPFLPVDYSIAKYFVYSFLSHFEVFEFLNFSNSSWHLDPDAIIHDQ
jgi:hypothetical protein